MVPMIDPTDPCPCGISGGHRSASLRRYAHCCGRWHAGPEALQAPDAEALMRSRYSAYVLGRVDYLLATWHPSTRPTTLPAEEHGLRWLGLDVKRHQAQDADHATVEFVARSKLGGQAHRLHEISRFERLAEPGAAPRWYYLDGEWLRR